jgi:RND family efflux transporter MFP subunit
MACQPCRGGAALLFCLGLMGCSRAESNVPAPGPLTVMVSKPVQQQVTDYAEYTGRIAAVDSVDVRARVSGYLDKINFKEGLLVKKGDVLFEIDPRPFKALVDSSKGELAANEALLKKAKADNTRNKNAAKTVGAVSPQDLDLTQAAEDQAIAVVAKSKASLETNQLNLDFTKVTSPIDGRISRYNLTVGNLVAQDQTLLTTIVSVNPMYAYFDVDEHTVLQVRRMIREGKVKSARDIDWPVFLSLANEENFPHKGTINFVDNQINPKTGTLRLRGVFPNDNEVLSPGFFARIHLPIGFPHDALLISDRAIDTDQGQKIVYAVDKDNKVLVRPIRTGALHDGLRVIEDGLQPDDRVVVAGLQLVRPGASVEAKLVAMPRSGNQEAISKGP